VIWVEWFSGKFEGRLDSRLRGNDGSSSAFHFLALIPPPPHVIHAPLMIRVPLGQLPGHPCRFHLTRMPRLYPLYLLARIPGPARHSREGGESILTRRSVSVLMPSLKAVQPQL